MSHKAYPLRVARAALGIRAQDLRTLVRKAWWARRWMAAVEAYRLGPRLGRARQYAINGQVTALNLQGPVVTALVQGSRERPYEVRMEFTVPAEAALEKLSAHLQARSGLLARLLTDDLPVEVEGLFAAAGCPLFPVAGAKKPYDVKMSCSCPDWMRPCKHMAAVLLLLGEEVTRRPATLLSLRGLEMEALVKAAVSGVTVKGPSPDACRFQPLAASTVAPPPFAVGQPNAAGALVSRLGAVPFWCGVNRCVESLQRMYARQQPVAAAAAAGESIDLRA